MIRLNVDTDETQSPKPILKIEGKPWELEQKYPTLESRNSLTMKVIKWVNDTFVPFGLTPIEDLPRAIPGDGNSCVIANVIKEIPDFQNVEVGVTCIDLFPPEVDNFLDESLIEKLEYNEFGDTDNDIIYPEPDIADFILAFDKGLYPDLIDVDTIIEQYDRHEAYQLFEDLGIKTEGCDCDWRTRDGYN